MPSKKFHILVAPLDWGIGHATRCVPIIRQLLKKDVEITVAASGRSLAFLKEVFPQVQFEDPPGFRVAYPLKGSMTFSIAASLPRLLASIWRDQRWLDHHIREHNIDAVISDNRFGFWSRKVPGIYITHQVMVKMPGGLHWLEPCVHHLHGLVIRRYSECWIPDFEGKENLSGELSHRYPLPANAHFIGPLTRFDACVDGRGVETRDGPDLLVMLSGPEPQRSMFEKILIEQIKARPALTTVILRGVPEGGPAPEDVEGLEVYHHLPDPEIARLVRASKRIVCRPGYSTIMDLAGLGRTAFLVPTPGQTEQEYLARYLSGKPGFSWMAQKEFSLDRVMSIDNVNTGQFPVPVNASFLENRIDHLLKILVS